MPTPIQFPQSLRPPERPVSRMMERPNPSGAAGAAPTVLDLMIEKTRDVNSMQNQANSMVHELLTGGDVNSAEVLTSVQKADMAFRTLLQVRNKLIEAYREVLQIQV
jgi:flagellar hook-basal body complex protein FliE